MSATRKWDIESLRRRFEGPAKVVVICIAIVWVFAFVHKTAAEHAVANVERPGVTLTTSRDSPAWMQWLPESIQDLLIQETYSMKVEGRRIGGEEMTEVAEMAAALRGLRSVELHGTRLKDLSFLKQFTRLQQLKIGDTPLTTFEDLPEFNDLEALTLADTAGRHEQLTRLQNYTRLKYLNLSSVPTDLVAGAEESTDKLLANIATLPNVEVLDISNRFFTKEGAGQIARMKSLHSLVLCGDILDDTVLDTLAKCSGLTDLCISAGQFSPRAVQKFTLACPQCKIHSGNNASIFAKSLDPHEN